MFSELDVDGFLQDFDGEQVQRDGMVVLELAGVCQGFLERCDLGMFPHVGEGGRGY